MLFQLKLLRSLLNPKSQKLISVFVVSFLVVGCNSLIPISQNCNFPEQNLVPGGLINIKKKNVNLDLIGDISNEWMSFAQCFAGGAETPPAPGTRKKTIK